MFNKKEKIKGPAVEIIYQPHHPEAPYGIVNYGAHCAFAVYKTLNEAIKAAKEVRVNMMLVEIANEELKGAK